MEESLSEDSSLPVPGTSRCNNKDFDKSCENSKLTGENIENYIEKLQELKTRYFEKKVGKKLFERCVLNARVSEFLHDHVFNPPYNDSDDEDDTVEGHIISQEERLYIKQLLEEKEEMNKKALKISSENNDRESKVLAKKFLLRELMQKRKTLWSKAAKIYENLRRGPDYERTENSTISVGLLSRNSSVDDAEYKLVKEEIAKKTNRIHHLSRVLHLLISFSGAKWAYDKSLLEILLCTGKILNCNLDVNSQVEFEKVLDDVIHRLNFIKI